MTTQPAQPEPDFGPALIGRLADAITGECVAQCECHTGWLPLRKDVAADLVRLVLDALPWPKPGSSGRGPTVVQPAVVEDRAQQVTELREARTHAVAALAEEEAELEQRNRELATWRTAHTERGTQLDEANTEIERLRILVDDKRVRSAQQAAELDEAYAEIARLRDIEAHQQDQP